MNSTGNNPDKSDPSSEIQTGDRASQVHQHESALANYSQLKPEAESAHWTIYTATQGREFPCRLTVFAAATSANAEFRAAWRRDIGLLRLIPHDGLPDVIDSGDVDGTVYYATEQVTGTTLAGQLASGRLSWDEIADIGWQISSVIQHLHNSGLAHGCLDESSIRITDQLKVCVVDTGVGRWLAAGTATAGTAHADVSQQYRVDMLAMGCLLAAMAHGSSESATTSEIPQAWWALIDDLSDAASDRFPSTAREVQGRLGAILLDDAGESMDVVADQTGPGHGRRSIVGEILPELATHEDATGGSASPQSRAPKLRNWLLIVATILTLTILALALWQR